MAIHIAKEENFNELTQKGFSIVDFYSTTCSPCKVFARLLEDLTLDFPFINIVKVNVSYEVSLGKRFAIEAVPTVVIMVDGVEVDREVGLMSEQEVYDKISKYYYGGQK